MAQFSMMWTTGGAGDGASPYTQTQVFDWLRRSMLNSPTTEGVVPDYPKTGSKELAVSGTSSPLTVAPGAAYVYGAPYESTASENIVVPTPVGGTTGHRIVLRADWAARTVRLALLSSANGNAAIPAVTQNAGTVWEISLATLTITTGGVITVTDTRAFVHHNTRVSTTMLDDSAVSTAKIADSAATDAKIGNRTVSDASAPTGNTSVLTTLLSWITNRLKAITGKSTWRDTPSASLEDLHTGKADRAGDTFTGTVTLSGLAPMLRLIETDADAGEKYWDLQTLGGTLSLRSRDDSGNNPQTLVSLDRTGQALLDVNLTANAFRFNGNTVWSSGTDGDGSGLDADLVAGIDIAPLRRRGGSATDWSMTGTNNYTPAGYRLECGSIAGAFGSADTTVSINVTLPTPFAAGTVPLALATSGAADHNVARSNVTETVVQFSIKRSTSGFPEPFDIHWFAIGAP